MTDVVSGERRKELTKNFEMVDDLRKMIVRIQRLRMNPGFWGFGIASLPVSIFLIFASQKKASVFGDLTLDLLLFFGVLVAGVCVFYLARSLLRKWTRTKLQNAELELENYLWSKAAADVALAYIAANTPQPEIKKIAEEFGVRLSMRQGDLRMRGLRGGL